MLGTLNGALEVRGLKLPPEAIDVEAEGVNEVVDRIVKLTGIHLRYRLVVPSEARDVVDRSLAGHGDKCPTAVSLRGSVPITFEADIDESGDPGWFTPRER
jgi:hypothetical protein